MKPDKGLSNLRKGRFSKGDQIYHCTFSTLKNENVFSDFNTARVMISILRNDENNGLTYTYAFVVMPDHIHWLFELKGGSLSTAIKRVKSIFSWIYKRKIWNKGFYDHAIREDKDLIATARYIVANPLRAGLVDNVGNYPHWDCIWLER
jgi:REP element-mobilizing transposase RayT